MVHWEFYDIHKIRKNKSFPYSEDFIRENWIGMDKKERLQTDALRMVLNKGVCGENRAGRQYNITFAPATGQRKAI